MKKFYFILSFICLFFIYSLTGCHKSAPNADEEIVLVSNLIVESKADFVKTSTGFSTSGATVRVVSLIKDTVGSKALIKAAGGVKNPDDLKNMINAGANRIGTSSGTKLVNNK